MNKQIRQINVLDYESKAAEIMDVDVILYNPLFYCWPQLFGSTSGPNDGIGCDAMTVFSVIALQGEDSVILFCGDKHKIVKIEDFEVGMRF